jgi:hypothetical protein
MVAKIVLSTALLGLSVVQGAAEVGERLRGTATAKAMPELQSLEDNDLCPVSKLNPNLKLKEKGSAPPQLEESCMVNATSFFSEPFFATQPYKRMNCSVHGENYTNCFGSGTSIDDTDLHGDFEHTCVYKNSKGAFIMVDDGSFSHVVVWLHGDEGRPWPRRAAQILEGPPKHTQDSWYTNGFLDDLQDPSKVAFCAIAAPLGSWYHYFVSPLCEAGGKPGLCDGYNLIDKINGSDFLRSTDVIIDKVKMFSSVFLSRQNLDRVLLMGYSQGGTMALQVGMRLLDQGIVLGGVAVLRTVLMDQSPDISPMAENRSIPFWAYLDYNTASHFNQPVSECYKLMGETIYPAALSANTMARLTMNKFEIQNIYYDPHGTHVAPFGNFQNFGTYMVTNFVEGDATLKGLCPHSFV